MDTQMNCTHFVKLLPGFKSNSVSVHVMRALYATFLIAMPIGTVALAQAPAKEPSLEFVVKAQDSLSKFSRETLASPQAWNEVAKFNQLKNPDVIFPGQILNIPLRLVKFKPASGKIISTEGDVTLGGSPSQPGAAVADGTTIKTGANSSVVIELGDATRLKILPDSLAEIITNRDYAMRDASKSGATNWFSGLLRLSSGALEVAASKTARRATPLKIETPTSIVGVRGTEFRLAFNDPFGKTARTEVLEGQVRADNTFQNSGADLPTGTGAVVDPLEKEVRVVALLPAPDLSGMPLEVLKPQGSWPMPSLSGASAFQVQVASDEQFDKIVRSLKVTTPFADLSSLPNGNWFARVRGIDALGLQGFDSVKLIAVKDGQWRVTASNLSVAGGQTVLTWQGQQAGGQAMADSTYSAVLATDAALTQSVVTVRGTGQKLSLTLGDLKPGAHYIRLQNAAGLLSDTYRFELSRNWTQTEFSKTSALQALK